MRYTKTIACIVAIAFLVGALSPPAKADVSFSFAYSSLSPHGSWLASGQYGRVWRPAVYAPGWNPYYDGHWVYTDYGWSWVSDYEWGSIPYHYGTWVVDPRLGWVWIPGTVWAPAWVVFCSGPEGIGWAPVPPHFSVGASISFHDVDARNFVFVPSGSFLAPRVRSYALSPSRTSVIIRNTKIVNRITIDNDVVVNRGPDVRFVEKASGRKIRAVPIERVPRVSPGGRFDREMLRAGPQARSRKLRAAEPVSAQENAPATSRKGRGDRDRMDSGPGREMNPRSSEPERKAAPRLAGPERKAAPRVSEPERKAAPRISEPQRKATPRVSEPARKPAHEVKSKSAGQQRPKASEPAKRKKGKRAKAADQQNDKEKKPDSRQP